MYKLGERAARDNIKGLRREKRFVVNYYHVVVDNLPKQIYILGTVTTKYNFESQDILATIDAYT